MWIPVEVCEDRRLYSLVSRNLQIGVFNKATGRFLGLREKCVRVDEESHYDNGPPSGTAYPTEALPELLPEDVPLDSGNAVLDKWLGEMEKKYVVFPQ